MKRVRIFWIIMYAIILYWACADKNRDLAIFATLWLVIIDKEIKEEKD